MGNSLLVNMLQCICEPQRTHNFSGGARQKGPVGIIEAACPALARHQDPLGPALMGDGHAEDPCTAAHQAQPRPDVHVARAPVHMGAGSRSPAASP
jgi:hypothetical protein